MCFIDPTGDGECQGTLHSPPGRLANRNFILGQSIHDVHHDTERTGAYMLALSLVRRHLRTSMSPGFFLAAIELGTTGYTNFYASLFTFSVGLFANTKITPDERSLSRRVNGTSSPSFLLPPPSSLPTRMSAITHEPDCRAEEQGDVRCSRIIWENSKSSNSAVSGDMITTGRLFEAAAAGHTLKGAMCRAAWIDWDNDLAIARGDSISGTREDISIGSILRLDKELNRKRLSVRSINNPPRADGIQEATSEASGIAFASEDTDKKTLVGKAKDFNSAYETLEISSKWMGGDMAANPDGYFDRDRNKIQVLVLQHNILSLAPC
ncbi:hypothetical protein CYLTODRAFT_446102 [Cylindrobasidium torrendii FP15055 ss-10]|uniref:Uncharacterized protein n=1 Tax=Cylindrobasidium torrendii FP15055 ss-10 TaxID=1314674 RepID=A0A0D7B0Z7_9AGAR|nr:hypothetical protein CYLTODRAFT_446102 [Cylindrobasidium torrendii FP15055 ss-10]